MVKDKEEYELVPEKRFVDLAKKVEDLTKNPLLETKAASKMESMLEEVNESIISLLDVMKVLSDDTSFDEKEKHLIKHEVKPLTKSIGEIKEQNETIANAMINIIDRINDLQKQVTHIQKAVKPSVSQMQNTNLPPITGGFKAPGSNQFQNSSNQSSSANNSNSSIPPPSNLPPPPK